MVLHRFLLNAFSQYLVFWCMTIMLAFARHNDAAKFKYPIHLFIFIPLHLLYIASILSGAFWTEMVICDYETNRVYPRIFFFQYALFTRLTSFSSFCTARATSCSGTQTPKSC